MRTLVPFVLLLVGGCGEISSGDADPCPDGVLSDADLPCDCQGVVVESLTCGDLVCSAAGLATSGDDTGACGSTSR